MGANEISFLAELRKRKQELEFKHGYLLRKGRERTSPAVYSLEQELEGVAKQVQELEDMLKELKVELFYPHENEIRKLGAAIAKHKPEDVDKAMESKSGELYALMEERGALTKENYGRRREIAALMDLANSFPSKIRDEIAEIVRRGELDELDGSVLDDRNREKLFKLLNRCGIGCSLSGYSLLPPGKGRVEWNEARVELNGLCAWVEPEKVHEIEKFGKEIVATGNEIQVMNAERQVKKFGSGEEKKFEELQKKYLEMVKRRNQLTSN
ncbi:MAG: hypothetical protein PHS02_04005 [Candidatus ainarchaeum sp.]|nr:hypothetical protein [Candidatus ainarchaeum sp.]